MALLALAVWDTPENGRFPLTLRTLASLARTVDWSRHRLVVVDNGSTCPEARALFDLNAWEFRSYWVGPGQGSRVPAATVIRNAENRGQARALNQGWLLAEKDEVRARADDDVEFLDAGWLDRLCDCLARDPNLGVVGLKRTDSFERPDHPDAAWRSELRMLPRQGDEDWLVEKTKSMMGTVQAVSPKLVDEIGFLYQGGFKWSLEDADFIARASVAGYWAAFWPHSRIRHLDHTPLGGSEYQRWKQQQADAHHPEFNRRRDGYRDGSVPLYRGPEEE
jgi:GT2 family glycosyltransferase